MRRQHSWLSLAMLGVMTLGVSAAMAADADEQRETLMKGFGQRMNIIKGALTENKGTMADVTKAASEISEGAARIPAVFPQGSVNQETNAESEALPIIWERWDDFQGKAKNMGELASALAKAADGGDKQATTAAFGNLGKNGCTGCHDTYRKKKS